jgi:hypothetical protein
MHGPILLAVRNMKNLITFAQEYSLQTALVLPIACLIAFTGCSSIDGTAANRPAVNSRVATYMQTNQQENATPADAADEDPGYEWFY